MTTTARCPSTVVVVMAGLSGESVLFSDAARPWTVMERTLPALATSWTSQRLANLGARVGPTRAAQYLAGALR